MRLFSPTESDFRLRLRRLIALPVIAATVMLCARCLGLRFNWTASMPVGIYQVGPVELDRGTLAVICLAGESARFGRERLYLPAGSCPSRTAPIVKEIVAVPGDWIDLQSEGLRVNGRLIPGTQLAAHDSEGRSLPHPELGERQLPDDAFWVLGTRRSRSWDSRYFGPIQRGDIIASTAPLWTWEGFDR